MTRGNRAFYPWQDEKVRDDVIKTFNLRLPEPLFLKLKFLADNTKRTSMHGICIDALEPTIEREVLALVEKLEHSAHYSKPR